MFSLTMSIMPSAAWCTSRPSASPIFCTAAFAASTSSIISPPRSRGGRCPTITFASVTAGADRPNVDARHLDRDHLARQSPAVGDLRLPLDRRLTVLGEGDVGRRPAHVEGE